MKNIETSRRNFSATTASIFLLMLLSGSISSASPSSAATKDLKNDLVVNASGDGTKWNFSYPQYDFETTNLTLPINKKVNLNVSTIGVNDTFWIPQLGVKVDANPFQNATTQIQSNKLKKFTILSLTICDEHKKHMVLGTGNIITSNKFDSWVKSQGGQKA